MSQAPVQPAPFRGSGPFLEKAPPLTLPMRHFAFAAASFWLFAAGFAFGTDRLLGFDFQARWALGLVHTLTLGWIAMTIMGAMVQMAPVLWEVPLASEKLARAGWWHLAAGITGFVSMLWAGSDNYWMPAALLVGGFSLYLVTLVKTMRSAAKLDWTARHLANAVCYLASLAVLGLLLAWDRQRGILFHDAEGALIAHVHLALVGWVTLTIFGVSYRLVSMFAMAHLKTQAPGRLALWLANAGLLGLTVDALWLGRRLMPVWAAVLACAYAAYAFQMRDLFRDRARRLDCSLSYTLLALAGGALWVALGVGLAFGWLEDTTEARAAYVFAALVGWVTPFILGQIHKIVPFLVWLHVYSPKNWRPPVKIPKITDLTCERMAWWELAALAAAVPLGVAGFLRESQALLKASGAALLACATLYAAGTAMTLRHVIRRDPRWT